jgi:SAM-dependent methyltransferase
MDQSGGATASSCTLENWFTNDVQMLGLYPESIQALARRHWTPLGITRMVVQFLTPWPDVSVLDIGSGVGKFCLAGAYYRPEASFTGIEQRKDLVIHAETARDKLGLTNAYFIHGNFTQLDFNQYDHFYFYNSFYENLSDTDKIDDNIACSRELYNYYNRCLFKKLDNARPGTRLVTFHSLEDIMPSSYHLVEEQLGKLLKFWIKI